MKKTVLVTGVSSGYGNALAHVFLEDGWQVYGVSRREPENLINISSFQFSSSNFANLETIQSSLEKLFTGIQRIDVLYLNAAFLPDFDRLENVDMNLVQTTMNINTWSNKIIIDYFLKNKIKVNQVIVSSSSAGRSDSSMQYKMGHNAFSLSKATLNHMIAQYALENPDIHFCTLSPGYMDTPMSRQVASHGSDALFFDQKRYIELFKEKRMRSPIDMARKVISNFSSIRQIKSGSFIRIDEKDNLHISQASLQSTNMVFQQPLINISTA